MIDLHNHALPAIDDGARDWEESLRMAQLAVADGVQGIVCTPHWIPGLYENTRAQILNMVDTFRSKLQERGIRLKVYPGAELRLDFELLAKIQSGELITINDTGRFALIELPEQILPRNLESLFWDLQSQDITPIISHPERNFALQRDPTLLFNWVEMGVLTQITGASLRGRFGPQVERFSVQLIEHHLAHIVATDSHGTQLRAPKLAATREVLERLVGTESAWQMVYELPKQIINGEALTTHAPHPIKALPSPSSWKRFFSFMSKKG